MSFMVYYRSRNRKSGQERKFCVAHSFFILLARLVTGGRIQTPGSVTYELKVISGSWKSGTLKRKY